jgi:hypothetical protein
MSSLTSSLGTTVGSWALSTTSAGGVSTSASFGNLQPGNSYQFVIVVTGRAASAVTLSSKLGAQLNCSDSSANLSYEIGSATALAATYGSTTDLFAKYTFTIVGAVKVLAPNSNLSVSVMDATGDSGSSATKALTFTGHALIQLVGSIS